MVDYFRSAGSLDEASMGIGSDSGYFRPAGDLDSRGKNVILPKGNTDYIEPFKKPEEIVDYFKPASDLNKEIIIKNISEENKLKMINNIDEINDYLLTVVSGKKHPYVCELGVLMDGGRTIVSLKELQQMVDEGYNIVSARVINAVSGMIEVEFQKYVYDEEKVERWRRF